MAGQLMVGNSQVVLIVDDQPYIALLTETVLIEIGIDEVVIAGSESEALERLGDVNFDLAVVDYDLGEATGWAIAKILCESDVPIIVTTDAQDIVLPAACRNAAILKRPYNLNNLASLVIAAPRAGPSTPS
jgi:CheY-like chemotaxis protein